MTWFAERCRPEPPNRGRRRRGSLNRGPMGLIRQRRTREQILDGAVEVATHGGYRTVRMRDIALAANVSTETVHYHFPSKVHLLISALARELRVFDAHIIRSIDTTADSYLRLRFGLTWLIEEMERSDHLTDSLTHAFAAAYELAIPEADSIRDLTVGMLCGLMTTETERPPDHDIAEILADVWVSQIFALVQQRQTLAGMWSQLMSAINVFERNAGV